MPRDLYTNLFLFFQTLNRLISLLSYYPTGARTTAQWFWYPSILHTSGTYILVYLLFYSHLHST